MDTQQEQNELFPNNEPQTLTRECNWCGKSYSNIHNSMYCSTSCKNSASRKRVTERRRSGNENPVVSPTVAAAPSLAGTLDLPPHAKFIIGLQEKEITRWETQYNKEVDKREQEVDKREQAEKELAKLKEQMKDMEHKKALDGIESSKPDFLEKLQQFIPEPVREKVLGALADKLMTPGTIAGIGGQLDGEGQQHLVNISNWFSALPKEGQVLVYHILDLFAQQPAEQLGQTLNQVLNLLKNGTTAIPNNNNANYGT